MTFTVKDILAMAVTLALGCAEPVVIAKGMLAAKRVTVNLRKEIGLYVWTKPS